VAAPGGAVVGVERPGQESVQGQAGGRFAAGLGALVEVGAQVDQRVEAGAFGGGGVMVQTRLASSAEVFEPEP
jgi:hypothetical protein